MKVWQLRSSIDWFDSVRLCIYAKRAFNTVRAFSFTWMMVAVVCEWLLI